MKNKIPPPLIGLACAAAMWGLAQLFSSWNVALPWRRELAAALVAVGAVIDGVSVLAFFRAKTTINPLTPERAQALVATGMFRFSRNPMYLGMLLMLCGWAVFLGQPLALLPIMLFVWLITVWQIKPEEAALEATFGASYRDYCSRVRRWV